MTCIEPISGKTLSDASDIVSRQIKYVAGEIGALRELESNVSLSDKDVAELQAFLNNLSCVQNNVKNFLATTSVRLNIMQRDVRVKLAQSGMAT